MLNVVRYVDKHCPSRSSVTCIHCLWRCAVSFSAEWLYTFLYQMQWNLVKKQQNLVDKFVSFDKEKRTVTQQKSIQCHRQHTNICLAILFTKHLYKVLDLKLAIASWSCRFRIKVYDDQLSWNSMINIMYHEIAIRHFIFDSLVDKASDVHYLLPIGNKIKVLLSLFLHITSADGVFTKYIYYPDSKVKYAYCSLFIYFCWSYK